MSDRLTIKETVEMLQNTAEAIVENEPLLTRIDIETGDGDHGTGMKTGFSAVSKMLKREMFQTVPQLFRAVGLKLLDEMGGASGVLFGTLFISGLSEFKTEDALALRDFAAALTKSTEAIMARGGAAVGDKTMIDSLYPAVTALREAAERGESFEIALGKAAAAAEQGTERTKDMTAKRGRAAAFGEKSKGCYDAGAVSAGLIFKAMNEYIKLKTETKKLK